MAPLILLTRYKKKIKIENQKGVRNQEKKINNDSENKKLKIQTQVEMLAFKNRSLELKQNQFEERKTQQAFQHDQQRLKMEAHLKEQEMTMKAQ